MLGSTVIGKLLSKFFPDINDYYYHISFSKLTDNELTPKIPETDPNLDDIVTKRISMSDTVDGCILGLSNYITNYFRNTGSKYFYLYLYGLRKDKLSDYNYVPNSKLINKVYDSKYTREFWILDPISVTYLRKVKVYNKYSEIPLKPNEIVTDKNGNEITYLVKYNYTLV